MGHQARPRFLCVPRADSNLRASFFWVAPSMRRQAFRQVALALVPMRCAKRLIVSKPTARIWIRTWATPPCVIWETLIFPPAIPKPFWRFHQGRSLADISRGQAPHLPGRGASGEPARRRGGARRLSRSDRVPVGCPRGFERGLSWEQRLSHACVMRRILELEGIGQLHQFGVRSGAREEFAWMRFHGRDACAL